ncbi:hypothetical protein MAR_010141 [Mya arenaria]|uniref:Chitin-binding type-4 domain-containing protein n=1 Tax=Mya arenaria TaxID=6604 RepID=A0ABY7E0Q1_MYAAR|nr:hypothetical protein MAR_010141 [Mya arenaria]
MKGMILAALVCWVFVAEVESHGRLMDPPARASAWRAGFPTPRNYDDNALFCGGFANRMNQGNKCGVCGDPYNGRRENEAGGKFATGTIVRKYKMGQVVTMKVDITANHFGWMEFRICPNNNVNVPVKQACLDKHVLQRADGQGTKEPINDKRTGYWNMDFRLPAGMTCSQCVIQWKYHAANSWGVGSNGEACVGCGEQEEFYGCADVAIEADGAPLPPVTQVPPQTTAAPPKTTRPTTTRTTPTTTTPRPTMTNVQKETTRFFIGARVDGDCYAINLWKGDPTLDQWCVENCAQGRCPAYGCACNDASSTDTTRRTTTTTTTTTPRPTTTPTTTTTTTTPRPTTTTTTTRKITTTPTTTTSTSTAAPGNGQMTYVTRYVCKAINLWAGNQYLDRWCADSCARGNCPDDSCKCSMVQQVMTVPTTKIVFPMSTSAPTKPPTQPDTQPPTTHGVQNTRVCRALSLCTENCIKGDICPPETCECTDSALFPMSTTTAAARPSTTAATQPANARSGRCEPNGILGGAYWSQWCQDQCDRGYCAVDQCICYQN